MSSVSVVHSCQFSFGQMTQPKRNFYLQLKISIYLKCFLDAIKENYTSNELPCSLFSNFILRFTQVHAGPFRGARGAEDPFTMVSSKSEPFS